MINAQSLLQREIPTAYRNAVQQFADNTGLSCDALLEGKSFDYKGIQFSFENYGAADPDGLFLLVQAAQFTGENECLICRRVLEINMLVPAARVGYYAVMPGTNCVMFCVRIDLATTPEPHVIAAALMETVRGELERTMSELTRAADDAAGVNKPACETSFA